MLIKINIVAVIFLALICTSAYPQDWKGYRRISPPASSGEFRNQSRTGKFFDRRTNAPKGSHKSQSNFRHTNETWRNNQMPPRHNPYIERNFNSSRWENRWDKKWRNRPVYWRSYDLRYKNSFGEYEEEERIQIIRKWESSDQAEDKEPRAEEKKIFAKPKIVTVDEKAGAFSQPPDPQKGNGEKSAKFYDAESKIKIANRLQKKVHTTKAGVIEIYGLGE